MPSHRRHIGLLGCIAALAFTASPDSAGAAGSLPAPALDHITVVGPGSIGPIDGMTVQGRTLGATASDVVNALVSCKGDGVTDDAACIRGLFASNRTIVFPAGHTYSLCGLVPPFDYPAFNEANVAVRGLINFHVQARGAIFKGCPGIPLSSQFLIAESQHWTWDGGTIIGDRSVLQAGNENVAMAIINDVDFRVHLERVTGFGGNGAAVAGDWLANGQIDVDDMDGVGHGFDTAFLSQVVLNVTKAVGADTYGATGTGHIGQTFYSNIYDVPLSSFNRTGMYYGDTNGVTVFNTNATNFATGVGLASGSNFFFLNSSMDGMPGIGNVQGHGYLIYYNNGGVASSVGHPVHNVNLIGGSASSNGVAVGGLGMLIAAGAIPAGSADVIDGISISGTLFDNNLNEGVDTDGGAAIANLNIAPSTTFKGALQTTAVGGGALAKMTPLGAAMVGGSPLVGLDLTRKLAPSGLSIALGNNQALAWQGAAGGGAVPIMSVGPSGISFVRPASASAYGQLQDFSGNPQLQWGAGGLQATATLQDQNLTFAALPTTGRFSGQHVYCSDCRNPGEVAGQGTGTIVYVNKQGTWTTVGTSLPASN